MQSTNICIAIVAIILDLGRVVMDYDSELWGF